MLHLRNKVRTALSPIRPDMEMFLDILLCAVVYGVTFFFCFNLIYCPSLGLVGIVEGFYFVIAIQSLSLSDLAGVFWQCSFFFFFSFFKKDILVSDLSSCGNTRLSSLAAEVSASLL